MEYRIMDKAMPWITQRMLRKELHDPEKAGLGKGRGTCQFPSTVGYPLTKTAHHPHPAMTRSET